MRRSANGIFYCRKELQNTLWPLTGAGRMGSVPGRTKVLGVRQSIGPTAMALGHAIDFANAIGIENIEARQRALMTKFKNDLRGVRRRRADPGGPACYCAMSAFAIPNVSGHNLSAYLLDKHNIVVSERANGFRADIGYYNSREDLEKTVDVVADAVRKGSFKTTAQP